MKFRRSAPTFLITMVIVSVLSLSYISNQITAGLLATAEEGQFNTMGTLMRSKLKNAEDRTVARAEMISTMPTVREAFANRDRKKLLDLTQEIYRIQHEKYGINQAQFHEPPAISFLRINKPEIYGDDISSFRQLVVDTNRNLAIRKGVEVTRFGPTIIAVVPIMDMQGHHIGSFELGSDFETTLDDLKVGYGFELALFVDERLLRKVMDFAGNEVFSDQNRFGKYLKYYSTHSELINQLISEKDVNITEDSHYLREAMGTYYGVLLQPLYDHSSRQVGVIVVVKNFNATRSSDRETIVWQSLLAISAIIILSGLIIIVLRGFILQPLSVIAERLQDLVDGNYRQPMTNTHKLCEEMQQIANSYEKLRSSSHKRDKLQRWQNRHQQRRDSVKPPPQE